MKAFNLRRSTSHLTLSVAAIAASLFGFHGSILARDVAHRVESVRTMQPSVDTSATQVDSVQAESSTVRTPLKHWEWLSMELGGSYRNLKSGFPNSSYKDWGTLYLDVAHPFGDRKTVYASLRYLNEFGISDGEIFAGLYHPITKDIELVVEGVKGFTHRITPVWSLFGQLQFQVAPGLGLWAGFRNSQYNHDQIQILNGTVEYWFSNYRAALTLYESRGDSGWKQPSYVGDFDYYYSDLGSYIGVIAAFGHEYDKIPLPTGSDRLLAFDTKTVSLIGRHWFVPAWALSYELGWHDQMKDTQKYYDSYEVRLGLRHRFAR